MKTLSKATTLVALMSFLALGFSSGHAEGSTSSTVLTIKDEGITSLSPYFNVDESSGLSGIRTEITSSDSEYEDVNKDNNRVHHSAIAGLSYDSASGHVTFEENGNRTVCGRFTSDRNAARNSIKELVNNSNGAIKKPFGTDYLEYVEGERRGERIFLNSFLFADSYFIPTGNCAFSVKTENGVVMKPRKSTSGDYKNVVLNVYPANK